MKILLTVVAVVFVIRLITTNQEHVMQKRSLIFPPNGSKVQLITGFGVPAYLGLQHIIVGTVFKASYRVPNHVSELKNFFTYRRKKRSADRWDIYGLMGRMIDAKGYCGKACILRTICEMAQSSWEKDLDLFHELLHVLFTPTSTMEAIGTNGDNEYFAAQALGENGDNCQLLFSDCQMSIVDLFSVYGE